MEWTPQHERAAQLVAADRLTNREIAQEVGITRRLLQFWIRGGTGQKTKDTFPEFPSRVKAIRKELISTIEAEGLASLEGQIADDLRYLDQLERARQERANSDDMAKVPGGPTGLLVKTFKRVGKDDSQEEYAIDTGLLAERRALKDRIAKLRGLIIDKHELSGNGGGPIKVLNGVSMADL